MNNPIESTDASSMNRPNDIDHHHSYVRKRTRATAEQLAVLEDTFAVNVSPNSKLRKQLAEQLSMSERSIQIWFQNRRAKVKHMQKRAQMQMQQAAIRAQLYHYHQQQYGMMSYGPPGPAPPMIPLPYHHQQHQQQQPFYYPAPYMRNRMPLPRAQSMDAIPYYGNQNDLARSSFPTPGPEPFMPNDCATPPPSSVPGLPQMVPQHQYPSMSNWSVSPCYPVLESPTRMSRQSMPPSFNPLSHTLMDDMNSTAGTLPSFHSEFGDASNSGMNHLASFSDRNVLSEDFPDFVHGQMSPSLSPNRENLHPSNSYFDDSKQLSTERTDSADGPTLNESDMWISSSPKIDSSEAVDSASQDASTQDSDKTVNPSTLMMAGSSSTVGRDNDTGSNYFNATALTIGTWHRLKLHANDLICLYKAEQQAFVWFITEGGSRFKVEIPLTSMLGIEYMPLVDSNGESTSDAHFYMSQPPHFYMESQDDTKAQWIQCSDFTENKQASRYLRHTLKGAQLKQDLANLMNENKETSKLIHFLDAPSTSVTTPFLPSQQHPQLHQSPSSTMVVPSALPYPTSSYYCYPDASSASMALTLNNNTSLLATSEPPVSVGGFYT